MDPAFPPRQRSAGSTHTHTVGRRGGEDMPKKSGDGRGCHNTGSVGGKGFGDAARNRCIASAPTWDQRSRMTNRKRTEARTIPNGRGWEKGGVETCQAG
eukprot:CAMPEP_0197436912 /NCGR_PEP_ID=MMETSP1175-20131217/4253_1 /TAXON_ID=1003142 /ORGANISM="Triceratium dubium, Strain CCMP147" /LENGTH=98 /DNA_ID=CAMNT_0042966303 /DNA_START=61 /DNA_END=357 /DNA_ORIENTATION=+